jgi:glutathione S-transferase
MASIKIYGTPPSTFTRTVLLACHEKGIDHELVPTRPSEIGALNPFERIPAMTHGDVTLFESIAILRYFERVFGGAKLWPDDVRAAAQVDQWASAVADSLAVSAVNYIVSRLGIVSLPEGMQQRYFERIRTVVPHLDRQLGKSAFLAGDRLTTADLYLLPILAYFPDFPETQAILDAAPNCRRWMADMADRPSVMATDFKAKPRLAA